jgi:hypothetical protein
MEALVELTLAQRDPSQRPRASRGASLA